LTENFVPLGLVGVERQTQELRRCLHPATRLRKPLHVWIHGGSGTGKTVLARFILSEFAQKHRVETAYVCCWQHHTLYKVIEALVDQLKILRAEPQDTAFKLEKLERHLEGRPLIVVLDEIDLSSPKDRNSIIYGLCNLGQTGLICISRKKEAFFSLDPGARSRLAPQFIECQRYSNGELASVLAVRCELALDSSSCSAQVVKKIASLSRGDARIAIQTLRSAVEWAEEARASQVAPSDVAQVWHELTQPPRECILSSLTPDHKMLYDVIRERREVTSARLRELYLEGCQRLHRKPIATRTFTKYMSRLIQCGLVTCERARVKGQTRLFKPGV